jgi:hypothetical protein
MTEGGPIRRYNPAPSRALGSSGPTVRAEFGSTQGREKGQEKGLEKRPERSVSWADELAAGPDPRRTG